MEISTPTGNKVIELVVDYSPILTFAPPVQNVFNERFTDILGR